MVKSFRAKSQMLNFSNYCKREVSCCKIRLIIICLLLIIGFFLGVFMAVRLNNQSLLENAEEFGYLSFSLVKISSFSSLFFRLISILILLMMLFLLSLSPLLFVIAKVILIYRSYLLGLNLVIIILKNSLGGFFTTIFIILPIQLIILFVLAVFFSVISKRNKDPMCEKWKVIFSATCVLFLIVLIETLLLVVFSANIILVI